jgi:hypothetical protein
MLLWSLLLCSCCLHAVNSTGHCCPDGAVVGTDGVCCTGTIDGCGTCNGTGMAVDMRGQCCASVLTQSGECCTGAKQVDDCGVCGGRNECTLTVLGAVHVLSTLPSESVDAFLGELRRNLSLSLGVLESQIRPTLQSSLVSAAHADTGVLWRCA